MQRLRLILLLLFLGLVACETAVPGTPTPFPTEAALFLLPTVGTQAVAVEIADLLATPAASQDAFIQITGQYYPQPKLICESDPHLSPATWQLISGEAVALAGGFDNELRHLLPDGLTMTVEGYWLHWRGPIGCGKRAQVKELWYLQVSRIVDPSPIARVTLTPFLADVEIVAAVTPDPNSPPTTLTATLPIDTPPSQETPSLPPPDELPTLTPTVADIFPTNTPEIAPSEVFTPTVTQEGEVRASDTPPAGEATVTPEGEDGTQEATATLEPGAPTYTPTPITPTNTPDPNATATFTPTPGGTAGVTVKDELDSVELSKDILAADEIHAWPFFVSVSEVVTVTAITTADTTLLLSIVDEEGTTLVTEDAVAGEPAIISQFELEPPGPYLIYVEAEDGIPAEYALMLLFSDSLNFIFQPIIEYGASEMEDLPKRSEHFWHFVGTMGDRITVKAMPDATTDVFLELYGPDALRISAQFISAGGDGATEQLDFTLPQNGLYSIRVGEWDFNPGSYQLTLVKN